MSEITKVKLISEGIELIFVKEFRKLIYVTGGEVVKLAVLSRIYS